MVKPVRVAFVEWPEALAVESAQWEAVKRSVHAAHPDILITNELPFGPWLAESAAFSQDEARDSIRAHETGLGGLIDLKVPAIISTRPVWNGTKLANEAFVLQDGTPRPLHRKQYFPNEAGWYESEWYAGDDSGFVATEVSGIQIGVLICTEAMFNERARAYGKQNVSLIVIPRASGTNIEPWKIAGAMASLVAGAYVVSSNRTGGAKGGTQFGGGGFAYAPHGILLAETSAGQPLRVFDLDPDISGAAKREYPSYVAERTAKPGS